MERAIIKLNLNFWINVWEILRDAWNIQIQQTDTAEKG